MPGLRGTPFPRPASSERLSSTRFSGIAGTAVGTSVRPFMTFLVVEDNPGDARLLTEMLREQGSRAADHILVATIAEAEAVLSHQSIDLILLDLGLPDAQGLNAIARTHQAAPHTPLVVLTGMDDELLAGQALQEGAQDYLIKGQIDSRGLMRAIRYAIERKLMQIEREAVEEALFAAKERAQVTLDCIGEAVACTDIDGNVTFLNRVAEAMTGWSLTEAYGLSVAEVICILDGGTGVVIPNPIEIAIDADRNGHLPPNSVLLRRDGSTIAIEDSVSPIHDRNGVASGAVIVFRDVSGARAMTQQMVHLAQHDFLTGLPNRMLFNDRVDSAIAIAPRHLKKVAVLFLDLDGFKHINDSPGHPIGDLLLKSVADRLCACVRASDTVSRQGGDEFVVLLSEVDDAQDAALSARRMLDAVAKTHTIGGNEMHLTTSIGVSISPDDGIDAPTLIKNADTAMYQAKDNGRQNYQFFKPAMNVRAVERQSIEEAIRRARVRNEFSLFYQPKVDLRTGAISGAEALIRWSHPTRGLISPAQFIPIAEDCGLILPIGAWVLREACMQASAWAKQGLPTMTMAVNVSAVEFRDDNFLPNLLRTLEETGLDPANLELELTESVLMKRTEMTAAILRKLRDRGVQVAIDDFGTGYSSLSHLHKFPVDALKIDQSFIRQITLDGHDTAIVTAVIGMARALKLRVVAEGVETLDELIFLQQHCCDEAQGYFFSRPVHADVFAGLLEASFVGPQLLHGTAAALRDTRGMAGITIESTS